MTTSRGGIRTITAVALLALLAGCGSGGSSGTEGSSAGTASGSGGSVAVVASTNVWGDIVEQVAGDLTDGTVTITSIISNPDADPHSYEANAQNQLALANADVVIENGGGYDDFVDTMLEAADNPDATVLNAVDISGKQASGDEELNEHVWYDFPTVQKVADQVADALAAVDPADADTYRDNADAFIDKLADLEQTESAIKTDHAGAGVAITEPVPLYMLEACGLENKTPEEFSEAIEEGTDVSAAVLKETEDLFTTGQVSLLAYNEQTAGPETETVLEAAEASAVAVVPVTETLPDGKDYIEWMQSNLDAIQAALK
ncbi:zinc ABC transporter substrate-binding protein [Brooklawnia cerclae]|uniref:Zinc/manganese transport system substrate-binding protein n=1 Tax=Brooklawnia cerclae TaxID=349934 RepID=A0ABX0SFH8_9ACTN|nr:zinc ABC transporter substrate-binding protein [Brooklawnia cerclae]NIH56654.1 zinc/manganese transport system substrate-binding protein [Brooklawnia cerclae]